ncbi:MAG: DNA-binding protein [Caldisphaera sp.]|uniref:DNA-binding protein n=1 Tax=Caldisphaera sp. TaxID=2060322 RepID=UPI000CC7075D|nr:DNA-binding protein [Caldisphaera sp.]PMP92783.1 MAG: DNA-binding protein [Caldisphaera sp.]
MRNLSDDFSDYSDDDELEAIKQRRLLELRKRMEEEQRRKRMEEEQEAQKLAILRAIMEPNALDRLNNLKLVKPDLAKIAEETIIRLVQMGRLNTPVTEDVVKNILIELDNRSRKEYEFKFKWK